MNEFHTDESTFTIRSMIGNGELSVLQRPRSSIVLDRHGMGYVTLTVISTDRKSSHNTPSLVPLLKKIALLSVSRYCNAAERVIKG